VYGTDDRSGQRCLRSKESQSEETGGDDGGAHVD
jgi:hypothetical protein